MSDETIRYLASYLKLHEYKYYSWDRLGENTIDEAALKILIKEFFDSLP